MANKDEKKPDLRDKSGPGVATDTENMHSVLDRKKVPHDEQDISRPWPDQSTVPEGQNIKSGG